MSDSNTNMGCSVTGWVIGGIAGLLLLIAIVQFTPVGHFLRLRRFYGEAESVVADIQQLARELETVDESSVREKLATEKYSNLASLEIEVELKGRELMWFGVNEMFNVGLAEGGGIRWMVDGKRAGE